MRSGRMDVKRPDHGFSCEQGFKYFVDLGILLPVVAFGIFSPVPKAQSQDPSRFGIRDQNGLVLESDLLLQNGQDFVVDGFADITCFSRFGVSSTTLVYMSGTPFVG